MKEQDYEKLLNIKTSGDQKVVKNIQVSLEKHERPVDIILYYPSEDFIFFLESNTPFLLINEIKVPDLCTFDSNFRFLIYRRT